MSTLLLDTSKESSHIAGRGRFPRGLRRRHADQLRGPRTVWSRHAGHGCGTSWLKALTRSPVYEVSAGSVSGEAIGSVAADGSAKRTGAATAAVLARWG